VPPELDWNLWLGPAAMRPYLDKVYHPFNWRGWNDFGTGALGDMACHTVNMPFRALKLGYPSVVECEWHRASIRKPIRSLAHPLRVPRARWPAATQVLVV
jgi:hypothetical protein